jgi:membrane fusion protein (multidrug efflux system)
VRAADLTPHRSKGNDRPWGFGGNVVKRVLIVVAAVAALAVAYFLFFGWPWSAQQQPPAAAAPPTPQVGTVIAQAAEVPLPIEYAGRVVGVRDVEVRALVGGLLLKRGFEEGAEVKQGQLLFQIDPAPYQVALDRAQAQLHQAQAALRQAEDNFARIEELFRRNVSTDKQREEALAARDQARASVELAQAEIASARLNLGYTQVNAPVAGATALQSPSVGTLILAQQTLLTTITPRDPAYVSFSFTDEEGQAFRELNERREKPITEKDLTVELHYGSGRVYAHAGKIDTAAQRVDPQTGTIQARAIFPNPDGALLPGQFVRVRIGGITLPNAIVIPKEAVSQGPQGPFLYVVATNNVAEVRPIRLGREIGPGWVVSEGLKGGEQVIVDGIIRVRPGAPVRPAPMTAAPGATPAAAPAAAPPAGTRP